MRTHTTQDCDRRNYHVPTAMNRRGLLKLLGGVALVAIGVLLLLWYAPGDGTPGFGPQSTACLQETADCLIAPQAGALQGMIEALRDSDAAVDKYLSGAVMGGALSIFPIGGIAVLVGLAMYLPFSITLAYGVGCLVAMALERTLSFLRQHLA